MKLPRGEAVAVDSPIVVVVRNTVADVVKKVKCKCSVVCGALGKGKLSSRGVKEGPELAFAEVIVGEVRRYLGEIHKLQ